MKKFIVTLLLLCTPVAAEEVSQTCSRVVLRHNGGYDGMDIHGNPRTRFHVVDTSGEQGCPAKHSIVDVGAHFCSDIEASMETVDTLSDEGGLVFVLKAIRAVNATGNESFSPPHKPAGVKSADEARVVRIIPCAGEGPVGSGSPDLCCERLQVLAVADPITCESIKGGYICSDCGDGVCGTWENRCNCPEDCGNE